MHLGYARTMQEAMIPISMLEERRQLGHDRFDEVWEGVLHMVPFPEPGHQRVESDLNDALKSIAKRRGLHAFMRIGLYDPDVPGHKSYRGPDNAIVDRAQLSKRGIEGRAELVVEILSPEDEARDKLPFYQRVGVREVWIIDPRTLTVEVFAGTSAIEPRDGVIHAPSLGLELRVEGQTLHISDGADAYEVDIHDGL